MECKDRSDKQPDRRLRGQVAAEAAEWFARLHDSSATAASTEAERAEFSQWLLRSPMHIEEYLAITRVWGDVVTVARASEDELISQALATNGSENIVPISQPSGHDFVAGKVDPGPARREVKVTMRASRPYYALAASLLLVLSGGWFITTLWLYPSRLITEVGEQRSITLRDGSIVHLNTDSDIRIDLGDRERRIYLNRGEVRFTVAKDQRRPFLVSTAQATVRAVGTVFNVRASGSQTAVTVIEGKVALAPRGRSGHDQGGAGRDALVAKSSGPLQLSAGEHAAITQEGYILPNTGPTVETALAWSERRLIFRDQALVEVVAEFNRYHKRPIRIEDSALGALRISGAFYAGDADSLIQYLQRYEHVRVRTDSEGVKSLTR